MCNTLTQRGSVEPRTIPGTVYSRTRSEGPGVRDSFGRFRLAGGVGGCRRMFLLAAAVVAPALVGSPPRLEAQETDIIRGRVTGPDSLPIEGVTVTATSIANNTNKVART